MVKLALAAETSFRTTINTVVEEGSSQWGGSQQQHPQRCQEQIHQRRQQLYNASNFCSKMANNNTGNAARYFRTYDRQCRCEAVSQIVQQQLQQQQRQEGGRSQQGERQEEMVERAVYLPNSCNLEPRQCQIRTPYY